LQFGFELNFWSFDDFGVLAAVTAGDRGFDLSIYIIWHLATEMQPGTDVMIFKIFFSEKIAKKLAFLTHNKAKLCKFLS
jgi:hypothetical protein